jgi:hypothetical protein
VPEPDVVAPATIKDLAALAISDSSVLLTWTAPGDDEHEGTAALYDIRYASEEVTENNWDSAFRASGVPAPSSAGSVEELELTGLTSEMIYWFGIKTSDEMENWSGLSNVPSAAPDGVPPADIIDLEVFSMTPTSITLRWTAPGDDGYDGLASGYDLRYATESITPDSWDAATPVDGIVPPGPSGSTEMQGIDGLMSETLYYCAIKTADEIPNWSALSNVTLGMTAAPGGGAIHVVRPDGSGDFPTIQAAIDSALAGDVIELEDGVFTGPGNRRIDYRGKAVTVRSVSRDPLLCVIDCEAEERGISFRTGEGPGSVLRGITIRNGLASGPTGRGGGIRCEGTAPRIISCILENNSCGNEGGGMSVFEGASPTVLGCTFRGNHSPGSGAGVLTENASLTIRDCLFESNFSEGAGGGMACWGAQAQIINCSFIDNFALGQPSMSWGGGLNLAGSRGRVESCTFVRNMAIDGGGLMMIGSEFEIISCTFALNSAPDGGALFLYWSQPTITHCIFCYSVEGEAIDSDAEFSTLTCCDVYGNLGGDWVGVIEGQDQLNGNLSRDPAFCDIENGDLRLRPESLCAPENSGGCGRIGSMPVGCERGDSERLIYGMRDSK